MASSWRPVCQVAVPMPSNARASPAGSPARRAASRAWPWMARASLRWPPARYRNRMGDSSIACPGQPWTAVYAATAAKPDRSASNHRRAASGSANTAAAVAGVDICGRWCTSAGYRIVDGRAQPGQRAGGRGLGLHLADELTRDVHDLGDPAEHETRRLQRGRRLGLAEADHARDGGRVVPADGQAALVAEHGLAHVAQVADLDRDELIIRVPAGAQVEQAVGAPGEQRAVGTDRRACPLTLADLDDAAQVQLRRGELLDVLRSVPDLAGEVVAPGVHGVAGAGDRQGVGAAGRDLGHPGQRHR